MSVLEALVRQYDQLHARGEAPPYGFSRERIAYAIVLSDVGKAVAVLPLSEACAQSAGSPLVRSPAPGAAHLKAVGKFPLGQERVRIRGEARSGNTKAVSGPSRA